MRRLLNVGIRQEGEEGYMADFASRKFEHKRPQDFTMTCQ